MRGFTLIEAIIVIAVVAILVGLGSLSMVSFSKSSDIGASRTIIATSLEQAQSNSMAVVDNKAWGVHLAANRLTIYSEGDATTIVHFYSNNTSAAWSLNGGGNDILFDKRTGKTTNFGTITITGSIGSNQTINVSSEGVIE